MCRGWILIRFTFVMLSQIFQQPLDRLSWHVLPFLLLRTNSDNFVDPCVVFSFISSIFRSNLTCLILCVGTLCPSHFSLFQFLFHLLSYMQGVRTIQKRKSVVQRGICEHHPCCHRNLQYNVNCCVFCSVCTVYVCLSRWWQRHKSLVWLQQAHFLSFFRRAAILTEQVSSCTQEHQQTWL